MLYLHKTKHLKIFAFFFFISVKNALHVSKSIKSGEILIAKEIEFRRRKYFLVKISVLLVIILNSFLNRE